MKCSKCGAENREGAKFCNECAAPIETSCPKCGSKNKPGAKFCDECGTSLGTSTFQSPKRPNDSSIPTIESAVAETLEGERKTVTALFADIKGSTELERDLDPEEARAIVDPALKLMIDAVHRYDGYVVQSTGDGIFTIFGAPVAHEDHPQRALYAALRMLEELKRYSSKLVADGGSPIEARIGANSGEVVVRTISTGDDRPEYTPIGHTANLASRMQAIAPTGSIAITEATRKLVEGYFALKPLGPTRVKGLSEQVNVYEVTGLGPLRTKLQRAAYRGFTKFVGRDAEMAALDRAAELAKSGHGQIVAVVGEPGVGKSRLFFEFSARHRTGWSHLEAFSVSHGKAASFMPVTELLKNYFGIDERDEPRIRREKVAGRLAMLDRALEDTLPYLFGLLGLNESDDPLAGIDANIRRRRTLDAIKRILVQESRTQPIVVVFEDLHWIDNETQALLNLLAESIGNSPILLALNYRPEYRHDWGTRSSFTQLRLEPLKKESADEMLASMLGDDPGVAPLRKLIIDKSDATPFFIEEIVQTLFEEGALVRNGVVHATKPITEIHLPATVNAVLVSRIDRLSANEKELLQTLAVIGDEFALKLVRWVTKIPSGDLDSMLMHLQDAEFIYEQPANDDIEFHFKHALTREAAYNAILIERRKSLHELIAISQESLFAATLDDHLGALAYHYRRSGNTRKAVEFLRRAAEQSAACAANEVALNNLDEALGLLQYWPASEHRDREEVSLQAARSEAAYHVRGWSSLERERSALRALELARRLNDPRLTFKALAVVWVLYVVRAEFASAASTTREMILIAESLEDAELQAEAHVDSGWDLIFAGEFATALKHLETAMRHAEVHRSNQRQQLVWMARGLTARALHWLGFSERAIEFAREYLASAKKIDSPTRIALATNLCMELSSLRNESSTCRQLAQSTIDLGEEYGLSDYVLNARAHMAWVDAICGKPERAAETLREQLAEMRLRRLEHIRPRLICFLATSYLASGHLNDGIAAVEEGLAQVNLTGGAEHLAELNRLKGEILAASGDRGSKPHAAFQKLLKSRAIKVRKRTSFAPASASRVCCATPIAATRLARYSPTSTTGSPRASTPRT